MALDKAGYIGLLDVTLPRDSENLKKAMFSSFPKIVDPFEYSSDEMNSVLPNAHFYEGQIILFQGLEIPDEWVLCDGNEGKLINGVVVPDLREMFPKCSSSFNSPVKIHKANPVRDLTENIELLPHALTYEEMATHTHTTKRENSSEYHGHNVHSNLPGIIFKPYNVAPPHIPPGDYTGTSKVGGQANGTTKGHNHPFEKVTDFDVRHRFTNLCYIIFVGVV